MNWVLVVIVAASPVKTDLTFPTLNACFEAEQQMRNDHVAFVNNLIKAAPGADEKTRAYWFSRTVSGTCIPTK